MPKELPETREKEENPAETPDLTPEDIGKMPQPMRESLLVYGVLRIATALEDLVDTMKFAASDAGG